MLIYLVVRNPKRWPLNIPGVEVVQAKKYLTDKAYSRITRAKVYNLCGTYSYQTIGYYVSLLAEARGHRPLPDVATIRDLQVPTITRIASEDLDELIQKSLAPVQSNQFTLSIYFGRNTAKRYDRLSLQLFNLFHAPLLRANFSRRSKWHLTNISPIAVSEVPESHRDFIVQVAMEYFAGRRHKKAPEEPRYTMAILHNPDELAPPSNERALRRFIRAAEDLDIEADLIERDDLGRLPEYDALFIRETTAVNNHTFMFARRAQAEGMFVIDDPQSILKCSNKVYLAELLTRHHILIPRTIIAHSDNLQEVIDQIGLPCVLKQPDSAFSMGVVKADTPEALRQEATKMLDKSDLVIAQEFLPTPYDWRVAVLNGEPLFVCKYYMAPRHWQVVRWRTAGRKLEGRSETLRVSRAPKKIVDTAVRAAKLIGKGLYGVDLKMDKNKCYVIEVNDNPNIDAGIEDLILKDRLYDKVMAHFLVQLEALRRGRNKRK